MRNRPNFLLMAARLIGEGNPVMPADPGIQGGGSAGMVKTKTGFRLSPE
jgi:hypothetical protein